MQRLDPHESLGYHCSLTVKAFMSALEKKLKRLGVSKAQFLALEHLIASGPLSQSELAERLAITPRAARGPDGAGRLGDAPVGTGGRPGQACRSHEIDHNFMARCFSSGSRVAGSGLSRDPAGGNRHREASPKKGPEEPQGLILL